MTHRDLVVVGAGIVGLGAAWAAAKRGARVTVIESGPKARGASVRNFGMVWPIGQPLGWRREMAIRNRELWLSLADEHGVEVRRCGSIHVAHHDDEWQTLRQFAAAAPDAGFELLTPEETMERSPAVVPTGLRGGLFSPLECGVEPRRAIAAIAAALRSIGVAFDFDTQVVLARDGHVQCADGRRFESERIMVCSGPEFASLFPREHRASGLRLCKLQMLRCGPQPEGFQLGAHLASGLTLRHYESFHDCPAAADVAARIAQEAPELDRFGIHVMASQGMGGQIILGDSHQYDADITPFDSADIEGLLLRELRKVYRLPCWDVQERWHGVYAPHREHPFIELDPAPGVKILNGLGGHGMTMGLAAAERVVAGWLPDAAGRP